MSIRVVGAGLIGIVFTGPAVFAQPGVGRAAFETRCARCHGGDAAAARWDRRSRSGCGDSTNRS